MPTIIRVQQGGIVPVRNITREVRTDALNGRRIHPTGVTITIRDPADSTSIVSAAALSFIQTGDFVYYWDTTGLPLGDYLAKVRFGFAFTSASGGATKVSERDVILRLVRSV